VHLYLDEMVEDMADNLAAFRAGPQQQPGAGGPWPMLQGNPFQPYQVNLLVDNNETRSQPIVVEHNPITKTSLALWSGSWTGQGCGPRTSAASTWVLW